MAYIKKCLIWLLTVMLFTGCGIFEYSAIAETIFNDKSEPSA